MTTVLKIGGSEVTDKKRKLEFRYDSGAGMGPVKSAIDDYFRGDDVERYCREILEGMKDPSALILTHGAGAIPHYLVEETLAPPETVQAAAHYTNDVFCRIASECGLKVRGHDPAKIVRHTVNGFDWSGFLAEIERDRAEGFIPVAHGTLAPSDTGGPYGGCVVLSGDLVPVIEAAQYRTGYIFFTSDQRGIYDKNPAEPGARLLEKITPRTDVSKYSIRGREKDVSGGPMGKVKLLQQAAGTQKISSFIFSALENGNLRKVLAGNLSVVGTTIADE